MKPSPRSFGGGGGCPAPSVRVRRGRRRNKSQRAAPALRRCCRKKAVYTRAPILALRIYGRESYGSSDGTPRTVRLSPTRRRVCSGVAQIDSGLSTSQSISHHTAAAAAAAAAAGACRRRGRAQAQRNGGSARAAVHRERYDAL
eukprot:SAG31_NODE_1273_length_9057_cov_13.364103_3_plen_144_part_00